MPTTAFDKNLDSGTADPIDQLVKTDLSPQLISIEIDEALGPDEHPYFRLTVDFNREKFNQALTEAGVFASDLDPRGVIQIKKIRLSKEKAPYLPTTNEVNRHVRFDQKTGELTVYFGNAESVTNEYHPSYRDIETMRQEILSAILTTVVEAIPLPSQQRWELILDKSGLSYPKQEARIRQLEIRKKLEKELSKGEFLTMSRKDTKAIFNRKAQEVYAAIEERRASANPLPPWQRSDN